MRIDLRPRLEIALIAAALSVAGIASVHADSPGGLFIDLDDGGAAVIRPPTAQAKAHIAKPAAIPDADIVAAIKEGALPADTTLIVAYQGQLYVVPDRLIRNRMASEMVMNTPAR